MNRAPGSTAGKLWEWLGEAGKNSQRLPENSQKPPREFPATSRQFTPARNSGLRPPLPPAIFSPKIFNFLIIPPLPPLDFSLALTYNQSNYTNIFLEFNRTRKDDYFSSPVRVYMAGPCGSDPSFLPLEGAASAGAGRHRSALAQGDPASSSPPGVAKAALGRFSARAACDPAGPRDGSGGTGLAPSAACGPRFGRHGQHDREERFRPDPI